VTGRRGATKRARQVSNPVMAIVYLPPQRRSLPERIAYGMLAVAILVLGFFFLAAAIVAGIVLAGAVLVRYWWIRRRLRKTAEREFITTEYTVVEGDKNRTPLDAQQDRR
jgi:MFS superfamily sulfate permease-like transporter